jgi:hypothetical protein
MQRGVLQPLWLPDTLRKTAKMSNLRSLGYLEPLALIVSSPWACPLVSERRSK